MSAGFTSIVTGTNVTSAAILSEIDTALNERLQIATGTLGTFSTPSGTNIQQASYWSTRQAAIDTIVKGTKIQFLNLGTQGNPVASLPDFTNLTTGSISPFTAGSQVWQKVLGQTGPRRCINTWNGGYSYGACTSGDIVIPAPWLIQDMQKALGFLRFTALGNTGSTLHKMTHVPGYSENVPSSGTYRYFSGSSTSSQTLADSQHDHNDTQKSVDHAGWYATSDPNPSTVWLKHYQGRFLSVSSWFSESYQQKGTGTCNNIPNAKTYKFTVYAPTGWTSADISYLVPYYSAGASAYSCLHNLSVTQGNMVKVTAPASSYASASSQTVTVDMNAYTDASAGTNVGYYLQRTTYWLFDYNWAYA